MSKYYALMFLIVGIALFYAYTKDPCHQQLRADFSNRYPSYTILDSEASEGSPERVRCQISYYPADSKEIHEDVWLYLHTKRGWEFSRILETHEAERTDRILDGGPHHDVNDAEASAIKTSAQRSTVTS